MYAVDLIYFIIECALILNHCGGFPLTSIVFVLS